MSPLIFKRLPQYSFTMASKFTAEPIEEPVVPPPAALPAAAELIRFAASTEETRFNNLNSRAIALLSATSLVTALASIFGKEIIDSTKLGDTREFVAAALLTTLSLLVVVAATLVWKVLVPNRRPTFGNNLLTKSPEKLDNPLAVYAVAYEEYFLIHKFLVERNGSKAQALHLAYWVFLAAVIVIAIGTAAVAINTM